MNKVLTMIMTLIVVSLHRGVVAFDRWGGGGGNDGQRIAQEGFEHPYVQTFRQADRIWAFEHSGI